MGSYDMECVTTERRRVAFKTRSQNCWRFYKTFTQTYTNKLNKTDNYWDQSFNGLKSV